MLALPRFDVVAVHIRARDGRVELRRATGDQWVTGTAAPADAKAIDQLLDLLADLNAERFPTPPPLFTPDTTLDVDVREAQSARHVRLELSASCHGRLPDTPLFSLSPQPAGTCARRLRACGESSARQDANDAKIRIPMIRNMASWRLTARQWS